MTQEETLEGNKLIAEFMGVKIGVDNYSYRVGCIEPLKETHLNYHKEWGWLMPVVEKIQQLKLVSIEMYSKDDNAQILMGADGTLIAGRIYDFENAITAYYQIVIEFIKWHNTQTR
jgi:DNA-dependent RNA polymerase auxiliary subunit epsilon